MSDKHPFLEPRHVDDLIQSLRAVNLVISNFLRDMKNQHASMLAALQKIANHTENLPALMEVLMSKKANGDVHDVAEREGP